MNVFDIWDEKNGIGNFYRISVAAARREHGRKRFTPSRVALIVETCRHQDEGRVCGRHPQMRQSNGEWSDFMLLLNTKHHV